MEDYSFYMKIFTIHVRNAVYLDPHDNIRMESRRKFDPVPK